MVDNINEFIKKVQANKQNELDLSSDEDLSIAIMNLVSIEEHFFFTAEKTGKPEYFEMLAKVREMRKELLKRIIKEYEGEVWCISKHLLAKENIQKVSEVIFHEMTHIWLWNTKKPWGHTPEFYEKIKTFNVDLLELNNG